MLLNVAMINSEIAAWLSVLSDFFGLIASLVAIGIFAYSIVKRKKIFSLFRAISNYSHQITLTDLKVVLGKLEVLDGNNPANKQEILSLTSGLIGQIKGNNKIYFQVSDIVDALEEYLDNPKQRFTEPIKRNLLCQLAERLRQFDVENFSVAEERHG